MRDILFICLHAPHGVERVKANDKHIALDPMGKLLTTL